MDQLAAAVPTTATGRTPAIRTAGVLVLVALGFVTIAQQGASAQTYPDRPIKIIIPSGAGGPTDVPARLAAQILQPKFGQPIVIENRPGAAGVIGAKAVAGAPPDGYTLMAGNTSVLAVVPAVSASAGFDPVRDFAPIAKVSESFQILVVHPSVPVRTLKEFIAYAKANPGKLNYAHTGLGGLPHLTGELFKAKAGVDLVGVSYRSGGESVTATLSAAVHLTFESVTILLPLIREGKLRALAVTSRERSPLAPDLPTMIEAGVPDYEVVTFNGLVAPAKTPEAIRNRIAAAINEGLATAEVQDLIRKLGAVTDIGTPEAFGAFIDREYRKWTAVGKIANVRIN
jgi:tripartite-type tricarboxylate transporter receptor subunit TctC